MRGGYLTLDLREIKNTDDVLIKKGIYNYILNTNKPIEVIVSKEFIEGFMGNEKGVLCNTFRINFTNLRETSDLGERGGSEIFLPIIYDENYDEVKDVLSIGYGYYKCVITSNDEIYLGEI